MCCIFMVSLGHLNYLKFLISQVIRPPAFDCRQCGGSGFRDIGLGSFEASSSLENR